METKTEKEYQQELDKVPTLLHEAYLKGRRDEHKEWTNYLLPETLEVTMRIRGENDEVENIRQILSFSEIKQGRTNIISYFLEKMFQELAINGKILKDLLTTTLND